MAYFADLGSTVDISMEELAPFMDSPEHDTAHSEDVQNFEVVENDGPMIVVTFERKWDGEWVKSRTRLTSFPPYCRFVEELEGVFAGSKFVGVHRPEGAKTRVELCGDVHYKGRDTEEARRVFLAVLAKSHEEDVAALRRYRSRK